MREVKCRGCVNYKAEWCEKIVDSPEPDIMRDCQFFRMRTNADRIRAMSDAELAELFAEIYNEGVEDATEYYRGVHKNFFVWNRNWLSRPAEGEQHE